MSGPKETWGKAHPVPVAPPSTSYNPPPHTLTSKLLQLRGWVYLPFPQLLFPVNPAPSAMHPLGLLAHSSSFGLFASPLFSASLALPTLSALMGPFSLDFSRCLWLNSPSYLEQNPSPRRYLETVTSQFRSDVSTRYLHVRSETNYWKF